MQTTQAQIVTERVPTRSGRTPNDAGSNRGAQRSSVKNSVSETSRKNSIDGSSRAATIPTVVATETKAQRARTPLIASSPQRLRSARRLTGGAPVASLVANYAPVAPSNVDLDSSSCSSLSG